MSEQVSERIGMQRTKGAYYFFAFLLFVSNKWLYLYFDYLCLNFDFITIIRIFAQRKNTYGNCGIAGNINRESLSVHSKTGKHKYDEYFR